MMHRRPSPFSMYSKALLISENGTEWVMNFSTSSSCNIRQKEILHFSSCAWRFVLKVNLNSQIYLVHVFFHHSRNIRTGLVVPKEGSLESSFIQQVDGVGLEDIIFVWYPHNYCNTPTLRQQYGLIQRHKTTPYNDLELKMTALLGSQENGIKEYSNHIHHEHIRMQKSWHWHFQCIRGFCRRLHRSSPQ